MVQLESFKIFLNSLSQIYIYIHVNNTMNKSRKKSFESYYIRVQTELENIAAESIHCCQ